MISRILFVTGLVAVVYGADAFRPYAGPIELSGLLLAFTVLICKINVEKELD